MGYLKKYSVYYNYGFTTSVKFYITFMLTKQHIYFKQLFALTGVILELH